MNWNSSFFGNMIRTGLCVLLCGAILLGLILPGVDMAVDYPDNPFENEAIREISILKVGENASDLDSIVVPVEGSVSPSEPDESEPLENPPEETEEIEPEETEETEPEETVEGETTPEETDPTESEGAEGEEGNDDGNQGEEGGEELELDLAAVMTWYKYGNEPQTIVCSPSGAVSKTLNTAHLTNDTLKYEFTLTGTDVKYMEIQSVTLAVGEGAMGSASQSGSIEIQLPETNFQKYTFRVNARIEITDISGEQISQDVTFTFVLKCENVLDLEVELTWKPVDGAERTVVCGPNKTEAFSVRNYDLTDRVFQYKVKLTGGLAEDAKIEKASYTTSSGTKSGEIDGEIGSLILDHAPGSDKETYLFTFTVRVGEEEVTYTYKLTYQETLDVQLVFNYMEKGTVEQSRTCQAGDHITIRIKNNQLSAGALPFTMALTGKDGAEGRILNASYTSDAGDSGNLETNGSVPMTMPSGASSNTYRITVNAMVKGQKLTFEIYIYFTADISLKMTYSVMENGAAVTREIICENARSKTADAIYDNQLSTGVLSYSMVLVGMEDKQVSITSVSCYQSGSKRNVTLTPNGQITLLLDNGKTGENTFEITAQDGDGNVYRFTINIPYKHKGENTIKIKTNLTEGQILINESKTNLTVEAWSQDEAGNVLSYIPANGTDTKLIVKFDGEELKYVSSSGKASEYSLFPANPEVGDTNTHTLSIYAEDALGNFGELTLTLNGQRSEAGQSAGKATIYIDMSVLGLGVVTSISYDVLADEPVSYVVAKAVLGQDTGHPFGKAKETLGWGGRTAGTLDIGYYLQSLVTGYTPIVLEGSSWPGSTEAEVLAAIDARFGEGTPLAILWRCLYRNGLNKSSGSGSEISEFDFTSGSGWLYSIGGATYYPGQSMSSVYLQDGDVLTLRYTLSQGWDVGGGTPGYSATVGYCISMVNGSHTINHRIEATENADGSITNACRCCGIIEPCAHENMTFLDQSDGTHIQFCNDCKKELGNSLDHIWVYAGEEMHICTECGAKEAHTWKEVEGSNTATCEDSGVRSVQCMVCQQIKQEETGPKGHTMDNQWQYTPSSHYEKCSTCGNEENKGTHQYSYISGSGWEDFECSICHALHSDEGDNCGGTPEILSATCEKIVRHCADCGHDLVQVGEFADYHSYVNGTCEHCGAVDSTVTEPTEPTPTEPETTEPAETEPTQPEPTDPTESEPTEPEHTDPGESEPTEPMPTDPTQPESTEPEPTDPTEPEATEPEPTAPAPTDPLPTEPVPTVPEPEESEPDEPESSEAEEPESGESA